MTVKQKDILRRVMEQYVIKGFPMFEIGIAQYLLDNIIHEPNITTYGFFFDPYKEAKVQVDHHITFVRMRSILCNREKYIYFDKKRDTRHENHSIECLDGQVRIEARWNKFFIYLEDMEVYKVVYNIRVHETSKEPILGLINFIHVRLQTIYNNTKLTDKYNLVKNTIIYKRKHDSKSSIKEGSKVRFAVNNTDKVIDLTEQQLSSLTEDQLSKIYPVDDLDNSVYVPYIKAVRKYKDLFKVTPYYPVNADDNYLHENYLDEYDVTMDDLNEDNLLKYNSLNVKIFNELMDIKYEELGSRDIVTTSYILDYWAAYVPAIESVSLGMDQKVIYEKLCAAFGKTNVDQVWHKYYK